MCKITHFYIKPAYNTIKTFKNYVKKVKKHLFLFKKSAKNKFFFIFFHN
jgi:hypothetical protein